MAVFGRRQPHKPIILTRLTNPQPPVNRIIQPCSIADHTAAFRYRYRQFKPIIKTGVFPYRPTGIQVSATSLAVKEAIRKIRYRQFPPIIKRVKGTAPAVNNPIGVIYQTNRIAVSLAAQVRYHPNQKPHYGIPPGVVIPPPSTGVHGWFDASFPYGMPWTKRRRRYVGL
jgi:hypothetical protein